MTENNNNPEKTNPENDQNPETTAPQAENSEQQKINEEPVTGEEVTAKKEEQDSTTEAKVQSEIPAEEKEEEKKKTTEKTEATENDVDYKEIKPITDFDWNSLGEEKAVYAEDKQKEMQHLYDETMNAIAEHEVIKGTVVSINNREVVVNIGFKSDGIIPFNEVRYIEGLKIGDEIDVYVESQEDLKGQLVLSHRKARILQSWERVNEALDKDEVINGYVKCRTKGGLIVDVFGIEAFLPGSQIDVKPIRDYDVFVGKTMEFKVVKVNHEFKNVVVSHKALIEEELEQQKTEIISKLEKGQILEGTVKNITSYGVFIDLGGVDGLIHITDLSWGRINHPEEIVELDQKIHVVILDFDDNKKRIALGLKQLTPHPWDKLDQELKVGDKVKGKVVVIADYGAFIEIQPGVEGLIHVSEMSWSQHLRTAQDFLSIGDEVEAVILTLDREERKMSLGMKQLIPDPWEEIQEKYKPGTKHTANVRNFTNFGIFVELEEGVDGLIHISDLSWSKKIKHPAEFTKIGEEIEVVVLEIDQENRRLSLGHKQLEDNPWDTFETVFTIDSIHEGTIRSINDKGAQVILPYGVEGFAPNRHLNKEDGTMPKADEQLAFKVIEFNKENKKIVLSHTKTYQEEQRPRKDGDDKGRKGRDKATRDAYKKIQNNLEKTTLGDIEALASLKSELDTDKGEPGAKKKAKTPAKKATSQKAVKKTEKEETSQADAEPDDITGEKKAEKSSDAEKEKKETKSKAAAKKASKEKEGGSEGETEKSEE